MRLKEFTTDFSNFEYDQYVKSKNVDEHGYTLPQGASQVEFFAAVMYDV